MSFTYNSLSGSTRQAEELLGKRREEQRRLNHQAATDFLESILEEKLPSHNLQLALRDGIILCRVINTLRPGTIKQIAMKDIPFAQMENISSFLHAAQELGVPGSDLFQTVDLYEGKNISRVVSTILSISRIIAGIPLGRRRVGSIDRMLPKRWSDKQTKDSSLPITPAQDALPPSVGKTTSTKGNTLCGSSTDTLIPDPLNDQTRSGEHLPNSTTVGHSGTLVNRPKLAVRTDPQTLVQRPHTDLHSAPPIRSPVRRKDKKSSPFHRSSATPRSAGDVPSRMADHIDPPGISPAPTAEPREVITLYSSRTDTASQYQLGNCIGKGQFGAVYRSLNLETGQMMAIKRIPLEGQQEEQTEAIMKEVELLQSLHHPRVVRYEGFIKTENHLNIVMEYVENGSLYHTLRAFGAFPEKLVLAYVVKIIEGLIYLHDKQVVHCDLKAANILTTKKGNTKLSDFGVSLNLKLSEPGDGSVVAGTPNWMAPEIIELKGACPASDIWSLGCTMIELLTGKPPYADLIQMTTLFRIVEDDCPPLPEGISGPLKQFLQECFKKDPAQRPTASELLKLPWISGQGRNKRELQALRRKHSVQISKHVQHFYEPAVPFPVSFTRFGQHLQLQCKNHLPRRLSEKLMPHNLGRSPSPRLQTIKRRVVKKSRAGRLRPFSLRRQSQRSLQRRDSGLATEQKDHGNESTPKGNNTVHSNQGKQSDVLPDLLDTFPLLQLNLEDLDAVKDKPISRRRSYTPTRHPIGPRNFRAMDHSITVAPKSADNSTHRFLAIALAQPMTCNACQNALTIKGMVCATCGALCHFECRGSVTGACSRNQGYPDVPPLPDGSIPRESPLKAYPTKSPKTQMVVERNAEHHRHDSPRHPPNLPTATVQPDSASPTVNSRSLPSVPLLPPSNPSALWSTQLFDTGIKPAMTTQSSGHQRTGSEPTEGVSGQPPRFTTHTAPLSSSASRPSLRLDQSAPAPSDRFLEDWVDIDRSQLDDIPEEQYPRLQRPVTHSGGTLEPPLIISEFPYYDNVRPGSMAHRSYLGIAPRAEVNDNYLLQATTQSDNQSPSGDQHTAHPSTYLPATDDTEEKSSRSRLFGSHRRSLRAKKPVFKSPVVLHAQGYFDDMVIDRNTLTRNRQALRVVTSPRPVSLGQDDSGHNDTQQLLNRLLRRGESLKSIASNDSSLCLATIRGSHDRQAGGLCATAPAFWCSSKVPFGKHKKKSANDDCHVM
ncbi:Protein kinase of the Mitotic Exit Network [Dispira simplex]|nr:Protein kinase of the Mitotic Exit Network [Dispira simplex]